MSVKLVTRVRGWPDIITFEGFMNYPSLGAQTWAHGPGVSAGATTATLGPEGPRTGRLWGRASGDTDMKRRPLWSPADCLSLSRAFRPPPKPGLLPLRTYLENCSDARKGWGRGLGGGSSGPGTSHSRAWREERRGLRTEGEGWQVDTGCWLQGSTTPLL